MATIKNLVDYEFKLSGADKTAAAMKNVGAAASYVAVAFAAAMAAMYATAAKMAKVGAEIYDTATRLNLSVETVQALGYVAAQTGSDLQGLSGSIRAINTFMIQADTATSNQAKALADLGLEYEDIRAMNPEQAFLALTDALGGVTDEMQQNILAATIFGNRYGTQVVGALNQTDGSLRNLMEDFAESGRAMSTDQIKALKKYDDAMTDINYSIKALTADAIVPLLPKMQEVADKFITLATENMPTFIESAEALAGALLFVAESAMKVATNMINFGDQIGGQLAKAWNWVSGASRDLSIAEQMADEAAQRILELQMAGANVSPAGLRLLGQVTQFVADSADEATVALINMNAAAGGGGGGRGTRPPDEKEKELLLSKELFAQDLVRQAMMMGNLAIESQMKDAIFAKTQDQNRQIQQQMREQMQPMINAAMRSADIIASGFTGSFDNVIDDFKSMLADMAKQWLKSTLFKTLLGGAGKLATGGAGFFL